MSDFARLQELARAAGLAVTPPSVVDVPYVSPETAVVGAALSCTMGNWSGMDGEPASYAYQWLSDGVEVGTGTSYTTAAPGTVSCVVTATNGAGSTAAPPSNAVLVTASAARAAPAAPAPAAHDAHSDGRTSTPAARK
jgi:hypothetical protein